MEKIDVHAHAFPRAYTDCLGKNIDANAPIRDAWIWDEARFKGEMDRWGIQKQILSLAHVYTNFEDELLASKLCRVVNDEYAEICSKRPDRFGMFAVVPLVNVDQACQELDRVKNLPGYCGIALGSHINGQVLDAPVFSDFFEYANSFNTIIHLHPLGRKLPEAWARYRLDHLIGLPVETTFALSGCALSGFLDKYAGLKIIAAHMGGALPYLSVRIERAFKKGVARHKPSHYFRQLYFDTSGPSHEAILACVSKMFGAERILFGTDYPFGIGQEGMQYVEHAVWIVENSGLGEKYKNMIFHENADGLLK